MDATRLVERFPPNAQGRDFIVGDVHGMFSMLDDLLAAVAFDKERDRLFSLGDLIDRGPASHRAYEFLQQPWFFAVRGNHEQLAIDHYRSGSQDGDLSRAALNHVMNGGGWFLDLNRRDQARFVEAFDKLPLAAQVETPLGRLGLVHADVPEAIAWQAFVDALEDPQDPSHNTCCTTALWSRERLMKLLKRGEIAADIEGIDAVFFGHTPIDDVMVAGNAVYMDTGAFRQCNPQDRGKLSLFVCTSAKLLYSTRGKRCARHPLALDLSAA